VSYRHFDRVIAVEMTGVVGASPALWYFRYIASILYLTLHKSLWSHDEIDKLDKQRTDRAVITINIM
jgi:hypothetical protein